MSLKTIVLKNLQTALQSGVDETPVLNLWLEA